MSNHPIIAALKARLESEREEIKNYHGCLTGDCPHEKQSECYLSIIDHTHEAATERLMGIIEKAVEMATDIERGFEFDGDGTEWQLDKDDMRYLAREFLAELEKEAGDGK